MHRARLLYKKAVRKMLVKWTPYLLHPAIASFQFFYNLKSCFAANRERNINWVFLSYFPSLLFSIFISSSLFPFLFVHLSFPFFSHSLSSSSDSFLIFHCILHQFAINSFPDSVIFLVLQLLQD